MPARLPDEAVDLAQAKAGALADLLGGEERLEHPLHRLLVHPVAAVGDGDGHVMARLRVGVAGGVGAVESDVRGLDEQPAAGRHGVAGVHGEIEHGALELVGVRFGPPQPLRQRRLDPHRRAQGAVEQLRHARHQAVHVHRLRGERLAAREGEEARGERRRPPRPAHRVDGRAPQPRRVLGQVPLQDLQVADHHLEQVVEVVRDAAGELAHRLHLLRLPELLLRRLQLRLARLVGGDVAGDAVEAVAFPSRGPGQPVDRPVPVAAAVLEMRHAGPGGPLHRGVARFGVVRLEEAVEAVADQLLRPVAERRRPGRVDRPDAAIEPQHQQQVARVAPDPVALPRARPDRRLQLLLGALLLVDIEHRDDAARHLPGPAVADGRPDRPNPGRAAVAPQVLVLAFRRLAGGDRARQRILGPFHPSAIGVEGRPFPVQFDIGRVDERVAEDALDLRIAGHDAPRRRFRDDEAHRHRREQRLEPRLALPQPFLGLASDVDVDHRADETQIRAALSGIETRPGEIERPAIGPIGAAQPELRAERLSGGIGRRKGPLRLRKILRMDRVEPARTHGLSLGLAGIGVPGAVEVGAGAGRVRNPQHGRGLVGNSAESRVVAAYVVPDQGRGHPVRRTARASWPGAMFHGGGRVPPHHGSSHPGPTGRQATLLAMRPACSGSACIIIAMLLPLRSRATR